MHWSLAPQTALRSYRVVVLTFAMVGWGVADTFATAADGANDAQLVASPEPGWPQWRGPRRDGICTETNLLPSWPEGGPRQIWQTTGLGFGYSAPILVGDRLYLTGDVEEELRIFALNLRGEIIWQTSNGQNWKRPYPGARAACTYSEGQLYNLNAHGRLACLEAATGLEVWAVDILDRFGGKNITWALSECVVVDGPRVIVTPGGETALMAALDKQTGETIWASQPLRLGPSSSPALQTVEDPTGEVDPASYASPILLEHAGRRQLIGCSQRHAFGLDADNGSLLWTHPLVTKYRVIAATPVLIGDTIFVTAPDTRDGGQLLRLQPRHDGVDVQKVWNTDLDTCHGCLVLVGDDLFGSWYRKGKGYACIDVHTGQVRYSLEEVAKGSVLYADKRLYCLSEEGEMLLLRPAEEAFVVEGRFRLVTDRVKDAWTHPVICNGRLYLRYHDTLYCYQIAAAR